MFAGSRYRPAEPDPAQRRRQLRALALAILLHVGVAILLLYQQQVFVPVSRQAELTTINITAPPTPRPTPKAVSKAAQAPRKQEQPRVTPPVQPVETPPVEWPFLTLSREELAASDIGRMTSAKAGRGESDGNAPVIGPGEGPGGGRLFNAEWYREPTSAELAGYLPPNPPRTGWGMIACKTVARYRVENCRQIGEFPLGSGFARAVRQAAWQFEVVPPRINGKPMIGAWVRIRIEYSEGAVVVE